MVLVCQKHYLPMYLARVFTVSEKLVAAYLYSMRICTALFLVYAHAYFSCTRMIHRRGFSTLVLFIEKVVDAQAVTNCAFPLARILKKTVLV